MTPHSPTLFLASGEVLLALQKFLLRATTLGQPCSLSGHRPWDGGGRSHGVRTTEAALPREKSRNLQAFKLEKVQYCYGLTKSQHSADWCGDWFAA